MTKEDWEKVEKKLSSIFGRAKLMIDGYEITICYVQETVTKYCLAVYVDGKIRGEWLLEDCDIRRKFFHESRKQLFTAKEKAKVIKEVGKRAFERYMKENPDRYYITSYEPYFGSFRTLKAHLIKNNTSIELIEE